MTGNEVKIVWDVTIGNEALFEDRMGLIQHTADVVRRKGMTPKFVLVVHGPATKFMTRSLNGTKFQNEKIRRLPDIQRVIAEMNEKDQICFVQCQVPMIRNNVVNDNVLPFVAVSETVFFDLAVLQMEGYAYIPINETGVSAPAEIAP
jgi:intracellular sulfur oxidation DsrE/DsrF family protein